MRVGVLAAMVAVLALFAAPRAEAAYLYWTNDAGEPGHPGTVGRANIDGTGANNALITSPDGACGVAASATNVYWAVGGAFPGHVARAGLAGEAIDGAFIEATNNLNCGVAVNSSSIFFNNHAIGAIGRANLDGSGVEQTFVTGGSNSQHPAVNSTHLFWVNKDSQSVGRATLAGGDVNQALVATKCPFPVGVAASDEYLYWANTNCKSIGRARFDGAGVTEINQDFIKLSEGPCGLAVDGSNIYWGRYGEESGSYVGRASLDGSGVNEQFVATAGYTCGVAVGSGATPNPNPNWWDFKPLVRFKPPVRCTKGCKRVLVTFEFDAPGTVVAKQAMPRKKGKGKAKSKDRSRAKARSSVRKAKGKRPKKLIKRLVAHVKVGTVTLRLKTTGAGKAMVKKKGKLKVKTIFTFTPEGGAPIVITGVIKAKPPKPKRKGGKGPKGGKRR